jgi:hypothetical protein
MGAEPARDEIGGAYFQDIDAAAGLRVDEDGRRVEEAFRGTKSSIPNPPCSRNVCTLRSGTGQRSRRTRSRTKTPAVDRHVSSRPRTRRSRVGEHVTISPRRHLLTA